MIRKVVRFVKESLTTQICMWVVGLSGTFLALSLFIILLHLKQSISRDAIDTAERTLHATELIMENTLGEVETAARSAHYYIERSLDKPELMENIVLELLKANPDIYGCVIAFEPGFFPGKDVYHEFYAHRSEAAPGGIKVAKNEGNQPYTNQPWYYVPLHNENTLWIDPFLDGDNEEKEVITALGIPIKDAKGNPVGILSASVMTEWLNDVVISTRPFPNSHASVIGSEGHLIMHPDSTFRRHDEFLQDIYNNTEHPSHMDIIAMKTGHTGNCRISMNGEPFYVFYEPFERTGWSITIVCPEDDIFGAYKNLRRNSILICLAGGVLLAICCVLFSRRLLRPVRKLRIAAHEMAKNNYDHIIEKTTREDELGSLQNSFAIMQESVRSHLKREADISDVLAKRNKDIQSAYKHAKDADRMKQAFIRNVSGSMESPIKDIGAVVEDFYNHPAQMDEKQCREMTRRITLDAEATTQILNKLIEAADTKES